MADQAKVIEEYDPLEVKAGAEKRFFIDMLTKDIELLPAIADLVDNSVDGARAVGGSDLSTQWIHLDVSPDKFVISDNAGGISADIARNYAFRFGRPENFKGVPGSVGQFGIGMKRAIFKLGKGFEVSSTYRGATAKSSSRFRITEDVNAWAAIMTDWKFHFAEIAEGIDLPKDDKPGTTITVDPLHPSVQDDLGDQAVVDKLCLELSTRHQRSLVAGLVITVNDVPLTAHRPMLQAAENFKPINYSFDVPAGDGGVVHVQLVAGTTKGTGAKEVDEDDAQNFQNTGDAGWYVFCNDRLLLAADKSATTGWGGAGAAYHPQYRNFRGFVYMSADDASLLPWNTTKTAVDRDAQVFRAVVSEMKKALVDIQAVINRVKIENARYVVEVEAHEERGEAPPPKTELLKVAEETPNIVVEDLPESKDASAPPSFVFPKKPKTTPDQKRIAYTVEPDRYEKMAVVLGTHSGPDLGRQTFEYVWNAELG